MSGLRTQLLVAALIVATTGKASSSH